MKAIKILLLLLISLSLQRLYAQAPNISYSSAISKLTMGSSYSFTPLNSGGSVPATHYGQVSMFVGSPTETVGYTDATGTSAQFSYPQQMVMDASGNLYVADAGNNVIRKATPAGVVTTFAGQTTGYSGFSDGTGTTASFNYPDGLAIDGSGNIFVADYSNDAIREITSSGVVSTFYDASGATFGPGGMCFDSSGNLLVAAQDASQIWSFNTSAVPTVIAGSSPGYYNAAGTSAQFNTPSDVKVDAAGNIYVADFENNAIRKISTSGVVSTFAGSDVNGNSPGFADGTGTAAIFNNESGLFVAPGGVVYVADLYNNDIRRIMPDGTVTLIAGSSSQVPGDLDGIGTASSFNQPVYMYIDGTGTGYISELAAERVRKINLTGYTLRGTLPAGLSFDGTTGTISGTPSTTTVTGPDTITAWNGSGSSSVIINFHILVPPPLITYDIGSNVLTSGTPYTLDPTNSGGAVPASDYAATTTFAGDSGSAGYTNATGTSAKFNGASSSVMDAAGNLYIADAGNNAIRKITSTGVLTTFAGSATGTSGNTDATGTSASFNDPQGIAIDNSGNLVIGDFGNNSIRLVDPNGVVSTLYHSTSTFGPAGLTVDNSGNIIVAAKSAHQIWMITPAAVQSVLAGSGTGGYTNATGTSAQFNNPADVKIDESGNLFVADFTNNAIREISPAGVVTTFAGSSVNGNTGAFLDGIRTAAEFNHPAGLAIIPGGVIYVADLGNNDIRRILPDGTVDLIAGSTSQTSGSSDGTATSASFNQPNSIYVDNTANAYVTDQTGNNIRQLALTGYFLVGSLPSGLSFNSSTGEFSGTVSGTITPSALTVTAFNSGGFSLVQPLVMGSVNNWIGGTLPYNWNVAANWSLNRVPTATDLANIGVNVSYTNQPTVTANATCGTVQFGMLAPTGGPVLTIQSGLTLTANSGFTLASSTTVIIDGPGDFKPAGNSIIASGEALKAALNAVITLGSTTASITVNTGGTFILASDQNGSAAIDIIPAGTAKIAGTVEVDRYITGNSVSTNRNYRFYTSPVHDATQVSGLNVFSVNYLLQQTSVSTPFGTMNYGNNVYGPGGSANGFNVTGPNPTIYFLSESHLYGATFTNGYYRGVVNMAQSPPSAPAYQITNSPNAGMNTYNFPVGNGFIAYFVGGPGSTTSAPISSVMPATGLLNQGTINFVNWETPSSTYLNNTHPSPDNGIDGNNFVGNPYPCTIDLNTYSSSNSAAGIYAPNTTGSFIEQTALGGSYGTWSQPLNSGTNNASEYVQSGAGFSIVASNSTATLTFHENAKAPYQQVTTAGGKGVYMDVLPTPVTNNQYLRLEMGSDTIHKEDILIWFNKDSKPTYESNDGPYMRGFNSVSLSSLSSDGRALGINAQPLPQLQQTVTKLNIDADNNGTYHFNLREITGLPELYDVYLNDAKLSQMIDLRRNSSYDFSIDKSDSSSFGNKRFSLIVKENPALAYHLIDFSATKMTAPSRQVQVQWETQNEGSYTNFSVERSTDNGVTFTALNTVGSATIGAYSFIDKTPVIGQNYYRLKQTDVNNVITYSNVAIIGYNNASDPANGQRLTIYPNPASSQISLTVIPATTDAADYKVSFNSLSGTTVHHFSLSQNTWNGSVSGLTPGVYYIRIISNKNNKLVAEGKFVKL